MTMADFVRAVTPWYQLFVYFISDFVGLDGYQIFSILGSHCELGCRQLWQSPRYLLV